jgi:hypothetical protein
MINPLMQDEPAIEIANLIDSLLIEGIEPVQVGIQLRRLASAIEGHVPEMVSILSARSDELPQCDPALVAAILRLIHHAGLRGGHETILSIDAQELVKILDSMTHRIPNAHLLLHLLAMRCDRESIELLVDRLAEHPTDDWIEAAQVLSPLMQSNDWPLDAFFPAALDLLASPALAAPILDLASFAFRDRGTRPHPASSRLQMLNHLLGEVTQRLARFEENPRAFGDDVTVVQQRLGHAVSLAVSLCDNVGLIGEPSSIGKLNQAVQLGHRRVQCEAAGALARMGDPGGRNRLVELASEPAARLRAIAYADELGFGEKIDPTQRTFERQAESEMALWLAQPSQMGVPPTGVETLESRLLAWPGFEHPVDVRLVRYEYNFGKQIYSNVGVTGPITHSLSADLADLPIDDIFAIYAGWHAQHDEIYTLPATSFNEAQRRLMAVYVGHLEREGYHELHPQLLGFFLGETAGIFSARKDVAELLVITDGLETIDRPISGRMRPMSAGDLFHLYSGRKMLRTFNGHEASPEIG